MKTIVPKATALLTLILLFAGCADLSVLQPQPDLTRFYFLQEGADSFTGESDLAIQVGPSTVAKILDKPTIATFPSDNSIVYSSTCRWAEPLAESIDRYLASVLSTELGTPQVGAQRIMSGFAFDYRVGYHILRLGGELDSETELLVSWWIHSPNEKEMHFQTSRYTVSATPAGDAFDNYVQRIRKLVRNWAVEVARTVQDLETGNAETQS